MLILSIQNNLYTKLATVLTVFMALVSCATQSNHHQEPYLTKQETGSVESFTNETYKHSIWLELVRGFQLKANSSDSHYRHYLRHFSQKPYYFERKIRNMPYYIHYVLREVKRRGMPTELALLPVIESQYEPFAYSYAQASGIWQIVPQTGRHLNLKTSWWYDERRDIRLATDAALDYLQSLYKRFGNWALALAAYNVGPGNLNKAIKAKGSKNFWHLDLPKQTREYVPKLLAVAQVIKNHKKFRVKLPAITDKPYFIAIKLSIPIHLKQLAETAGLPFATLEKLNPGYNQWMTPPTGNHFILVPRSYLAEVKTALQKLGEPQKRI